jgi:hypothetical protein
MRTLVVLVLIACCTASTTHAQALPRRMREVPDGPVVLTRRMVFHDGIAVWGRDTQGRRVMCVTFSGGVSSCHAPGVVPRDVSVSESLGGSVMLLGGFFIASLGGLLLDPIFEDPEESRDGAGVALVVFGTLMGAMGIATLGIGLARGRQRRRALNLLRERNARLVPVVRVGPERAGGLSLALAF